jgi:hypothetical protein
MVAVSAQGVRHRSDDSWHASETVTGGQHVSRYAIVLSVGALLAMSWLTTVLAQVDDDGARDQDARHGILTVRRPQATGDSTPPRGRIERGTRRTWQPCIVEQSAAERPWAGSRLSTVSSRRSRKAGTYTATVRRAVRLLSGQGGGATATPGSPVVNSATANASPSTSSTRTAELNTREACGPPYQREPARTQAMPARAPSGTR